MCDDVMVPVTLVKSILVTGMVMFALPSNEVAVPVAPPDSAMVRAVARLDAVVALPDKAPVKPVEVTDVKPVKEVAEFPNAMAVEPMVTVSFANIAFVIAPLAMLVVKFPAVVVTTPVSAGNCAAANAPVSRVVGTAVMGIVTAAEPSNA